VARVASRTGLIVTRNRAAAGRLRAVGVSAPILSTADNAFTFRPREADRGWLAREWPRAAGGVVGLAAVNFHLFPAVMRLWGRRADLYKWPYYLSSSPKRRAAAEAMARAYAKLADRIVESTGKAVALICMEQLDEPMARRVQGFMRQPQEARVFSAREQDASRMTELLRNLDLLITSRYHAAVLSLAAAVPQIAVGHDTRLETLYRDLGLHAQWFLPPDRIDGLAERVERLLAAPELQQEALHRGYAEHLARAQQNRSLLAGFAAELLSGASLNTLPGSAARVA
jgi:polysaccharide pyruvyl transferase WcaK-like protein